MIRRIVVDGQRELLSLLLACLLASLDRVVNASSAHAKHLKGILKFNYEYNQFAMFPRRIYLYVAASLSLFGLHGRDAHDGCEL